MTNVVILDVDVFSLICVSFFFFHCSNHRHLLTAKSHFHRVRQRNSESLMMMLSC